MHRYLFISYEFYFGSAIIAAHHEVRPLNIPGFATDFFNRDYKLTWKCSASIQVLHQD
jgi:hypothetical protein